MTIGANFRRDVERIVFIDDLCIGSTIQYRTIDDIGRITLYVVGFELDKPIVGVSRQREVMDIDYDTNRDSRHNPIGAIEFLARGALIGSMVTVDENPILEEGMLVSGGVPIINDGGVISDLPCMDERIRVYTPPKVRYF